MRLHFFLPSSATRRRLKSLAMQHQALPDQHRRMQSSSTEDLMRRVVDRLQLLKSKHASKVSNKLARAGWRSQRALVTFLFCKTFCPLLFGGVGALFLYGMDATDYGPTTKSFLALLSVYFGYYAPELYVKNAGDKRIHHLRKGLPDTLDLMVICAEAGLSPDATLSRVAREIEKSCPEMGEELKITSLEIGFLPDRKQALNNFKARVNMKEVTALIGTLIQTEKYGTPLAQSLRVLAAEFRHERLMKAEEKAARLPALLTVPMIVFILPPLFVVLIGPGILKTVDALSAL